MGASSDFARSAFAALLSDPVGEEWLDSAVTVDCDRKAWRNGVCPVDLKCGLVAGTMRLRVAATLGVHVLHWKKWRDRFGATRRKSGVKDWLSAIRPVESEVEADGEQAEFAMALMAEY